MKKCAATSREAVLNAYADVQQRFEELGGYTYRSEMMTIFTKFGFQEEDLKRPISTFSGGQKTRLAFVKLLLSKPDVLLLDRRQPSGYRCRRVAGGVCETLSQGSCPRIP